MQDKEFIKTHEFETSREAWDFMISQTQEDRYFSIPYLKTTTVDERFRVPPKKDHNFVPPSVRIISDSMGYGVRGIKSMADGKQYDSKSEYYKSLKEKGYEVVGNDAPRTQRQDIRGDFTTKQEVAEAIKQLGG